MRVLGWAGRVWTGVLLVIVLLVGLLLGLRLLLPLPFLSARPALVDATPPDRAGGVSPRVRARLRFNVPMNRRSVERALRIVPPVPVALLWDDDLTTLTISPTVGLRPDSTYSVTLDDRAFSRMFRTLEHPLALSFHTALAPAVVAVLPPDGAADVPLATPISVRFSRPIVPTATLTLPVALPQLRFDPPVEGSVTWIDQSTALFRPTAPLQPGTRYRATLDAELADLGGGQLGSPFSWSFGTPAPRVLAVAPAAGARLVAPRAPLVITLSQPLARSAVEASLVITPANPGALALATLPDATQLITYTPAANWRPDTIYTAVLRAGAAPAMGNLLLPELVRWTFTTAPRPALTGRFPGEGQILPPGQEIRLIFNTPVDDQVLRGAMLFTPPVAAARVTTRDVEARISADVRPSTLYTMTLPASLTDRNGVPLGQEYQIRFLTAPANPALTLPDVAGHIAQVPPGLSIGLQVRRTNLSALNIELYGLDEATTVRMLAFREGEWAAFQPERYGQPLLHSWTTQFADPLDAPVEDRLPLSLAGDQALPPGAYYLRARTPEGPRADLLALVSRTRLTLQQSGGGVLVWATDVISATTLGELPVALYQDGALIERGTTDASGLWQVDRAGAGPGQTIVALAGGDRPGVASSAWSGLAGVTASDSYGIALTADRAAYRPGERVALAGFVRRTAGRSPALPPPGLQALLSARPAGAAATVYRETVEITSAGVISAAFALPADAPAGEYLLEAALGGETAQTRFVVQDSRPLDVAMSAPPSAAAGADVPVSIETYTREGLPVAGAVLSWTLSAERAAFPALDGYALGDDERPVDPLPARAGMGRAGADGRFDLVITDTIAAGAPLRYRVAARVTEPGGPSVEAEGSFLVTPAQVYAGVYLPRRIFVAGQPGTVDLLAVTPDGRPVPQAPIGVEVYRRTWVRAGASAGEGEPRTALRPRDERVVTRRVVTGADGTASLPLTLRAGGEYRVRVAVTGADGRGMSSVTTLWVAAPGFIGWREEPDQRVLLVSDRSAYRAGDTATLLLAARSVETTALVTLARGDGIAGEVRTIRAGVPFTLTIGPQDAPAVQVEVLMPGAPGVPFRRAAATLPVLDGSRALSVTVMPDRGAYEPGATAILTVTTTDERGTGVPADVVLDVVGASGAPRLDLAGTFRAAAPPAIATAGMPGVAPAPVPAPLPAERAPEPLPAPGVYWNPRLHTGGDGVLTVTVQLPRDPIDLRALAWAAVNGADRFGQAQAALAVTRTLALRADVPAFFRTGDEVELAAEIGNTSAITQEVRATLAAGGVEPRAGVPLTQRVTIGPGGTARIVWPALVRGAARAVLSFSAQETGGLPLTARFERAILPPAVPEITGRGALVAGRLNWSFDALEDPRGVWGRLEIDLAPSSLALAHGTARSLAALPDRSLLDEASLLLVTAPLSDTRSIARAALDRLVAAQNAGGGWGWWPGELSHPFVGATTLEALAAAESVGLDPPPGMVERGVAALEPALADMALSADLRACALYALSLHNRAGEAALNDLAAEQRSLGPEGLACLILAQPPAVAQGDRSALSRLEALALREGDVVHWPASDADAMLSTDTSATALVVQALERARAGNDLLPAAARWLAGARMAGGWPGAYESARALAALRAAVPPVAARGRYTVTLNGAQLLAAPFEATITATRQISVTLDRLRARNDLTITSDGGAIFAGYRLVLAAAPPAPYAGGVGLLREYLDPQTGRPIDLAGLRPGQLVRARLTVVADVPQRFVTIEDALPAGFVLVEARAGTGFEQVARGPDHLRLASAWLRAGISESSYLLRAVVPGRYAAPPPEARGAGGGRIGVGNPATLGIAARG